MDRRPNAEDILARALKNGPSRRDLRIPLIIPEFAPAGRWVLKLRLRDLGGGHQASRELGFNVQGKILKPLPSLRLVEMTLRYRPGGPPLPGLFLRGGAKIHFDLVVGGMKLEREQGYYYRTHLRCTIRLRDRQGKLVASHTDACRLKKRFSFAPKRLRLRASWKLPERTGVHQIEAEVLDVNSQRVSMRQRRVVLFGPRRPPPR